VAFDEVIMVPFEDDQYPIMKEYDMVLKSIYGNYMKYPKEKDRKAKHHFGED
jgi:phosphorylcholine metabolism protein LicD